MKVFLILTFFGFWPSRVESVPLHGTEISFDREINITAGYSMKWKISSDKHLIDILFETEFSWIGFGLAEPASGTMLGSDILTMYHSSMKGPVIDDRFATKEAKPQLDCSQDWKLVEYSRVGDISKFHVQRFLNTNDTQDHTFMNNGFATRVIVAWALHTNQNVEDIGYHGSNRKNMRINFFDKNVLANPIDGIVADPNIFSITINAKNFHVPQGVDTHYQDFFFLRSDISAAFGGNFHFNESYIVAFDEFIEEKNRKHLHHFVVHAYSDVNENEAQPCSGIQTQLFIWASGSEPFVLPKDVGFSIADFKCFAMNVHYDNPDLLDDIVDSSGVKIFVQSVAPKHKAGAMMIGDSRIQLIGKQIQNGYSAYTFHCDTNNISGNNDALPVDNITIFQPVFHMHKAGIMMRTEIFRNGERIHKNEVQHYDFDYQSNLDIVPYTLRRGDQLYTTCNYYHDGGSTLKFGLGSGDEMCIDFMFYYPVIPQLTSLTCGYQGTPNTEKYFVENKTIDEDSLGRTLKEEECPTTTSQTTTEPQANTTTTVPCVHSDNSLHHLRHGDLITDCEESVGTRAVSMETVAPALAIMAVSSIQLFYL